MTIQQLQYLLEVYRTGSISRAAKNLYVAQSSVSSSISGLESELGFEIFSRSRQGVHPTTQGLRILEQAGRICESYRLMTQEGQSVNRQIRIGSAAYAPITDAFIRLLSEYGERSDLTFSHLTCTTATVVEKLSLFELDAGVLLTYSPHIRSTEALLRAKGLRWKVGKTIPAVLRIGPGHRLYNKPDLLLADFAKDTMVDPPNGGTAYTEFLRDIMEIEPERVMLVSEQRTRYRLVSEGVAFSVGCKLPEHINQQYGFRCIPLDEAKYNLITVTNPARPLTEEGRRFLELLDEELEKI